MKTKTATSESENESLASSVHSPALRYMTKKNLQPSFRKTSAADSDNDRSNFCFNLKNTTYSVIRSFIPGKGIQTRLYYTKFTPPHEKKSQVCIVHGYGESTDDFLRMGEFFAKRGSVVHMIDMRGFGYSGGSRVNEPIDHLFSDIETLLNNCCERNLSTFIVAHGLGALFVESLMQENTHLPISGIISISPLLSFRNFSRTSTLKKILYTISPWVVGNMLVHNMINPTAVCKNPLVIKAKIENVFFESFITLNMVSEYEKVCDKVKSQAYKFAYPFLLCYGLKDFIQSPKSIEAHFHKLSSGDKEKIAFPLGYHQMHKDDEAEEMFTQINEWMVKRRGEKQWKASGPLQKGAFLRWNLFWPKVGGIIGLILLLLKLVKKLKSLLLLTH